MAPPLGILKPIGKVEVEQANGVHGVQMEVPVASTLCLLAYGEGGMIKLLVHILNPSPRMAVAQLLVPTAYGDGLWGLQNTDITDAHGSIITDLLILFLMALWACGS